jgi:hypothetical protein
VGGDDGGDGIGRIMHAIGEGEAESEQSNDNYEK